MVEEKNVSTEGAVLFLVVLQESKLFNVVKSEVVVLMAKLVKMEFAVLCLSVPTAELSQCPCVEQEMLVL